jgi:hypothetical protein
MLLLYCVAASAPRAQATPLVRRQNLISESHSRALPRRFNSRSPAQPTVILDSSGIVPALPSDLFDRIIISQALYEGLTLVTSDPMMRAYQSGIFKSVERASQE